MLEALEAGQAYRTASIDAPDRREGTIASRLGEVDAGFAGADDHQVLVDALATLPEREQRILQMRFVDGLTQSQIAERIGVSQMHVSRLLAASIARLRESFTASRELGTSRGGGPLSWRLGQVGPRPRKKSPTWRTTSRNCSSSAGLVTKALAWRS